MGKSNDITLSVLGGGGEVGANCFRLGVNGHSILLDCGTHPKKEGSAALPELSLLNKAPDAVIVSHSHVDHCGSLPYLFRQFPMVRGHATLPSARIMDRMLHNSVAVMTTIARERGVRDYPLYDHEEVTYAMRHMRGHANDAPFKLGSDIPVEAQFRHAGHVLGSASILLRAPGHTIYYTGDICKNDQELMGGYDPLPDDVEVDTLIIESTHGNTEDDHVRLYEREARRLGEEMAKVLRDGGVALVPSFAFGRTQEMLNIISRLQEEGVVPEVPVFASGLGRAIYEIYDRFDDYLRPDAELRPLDLYGRIGNVWDPSVARSLLTYPCVIVATSGMMLENTPSAMIAQEMVKEKRHGIFFVGYLDHETLGYKLLHAEPGTPLQFGLGRPHVEVRLENIQRFYFSAHADRHALREKIDRIHPKNVVYVHGDPDAIAWMQASTSNGFRAYAPGVGQTITLEA